MSVVQIPGVTPSRELREQLRGERAILAFSRGKDSISAWLALRDAGVEVIPYHMYLVPDLRFIDESLAYFTEWFGCDRPILNLPHPSLYRWLANLVYQSPERCQVIDRSAIAVPEYTDINPIVREYLGLPADTWVCNGVRAADSPNRRMAMKSHGPVNHKARTQAIVWDWKVADVRDAIARAGVQLPPDYRWFKRSFDGLDRRFLQPLSRFAPDDYERILSWFPLADLDVARASLDAARALLTGRSKTGQPAAPAPADLEQDTEPVDPEHQGFRDRAAREDERFRLATDPEFWLAICFRRPEQPARFAAAFDLSADQATRYVPGPKLAARIGDRRKLTPAQRVRQILAIRGQRAEDMQTDLSPVKGVDPLTTITYTGDLAVDSLAELRAIHAALNAPPPTSPADVLDSPHWFVAYWPSREAKDEFLTASGLDMLGDKYLDGHQAARILGVDLS